MGWVCRSYYLPHTEQNHGEKGGAAPALTVSIPRANELQKQSTAKQNPLLQKALRKVSSMASCFFSSFFLILFFLLLKLTSFPLAEPAFPDSKPLSEIFHPALE